MLGGLLFKDTLQLKIDLCFICFVCLLLITQTYVCGCWLLMLILWHIHVTRFRKGKSLYQQHQHWWLSWQCLLLVIHAVAFFCIFVVFLLLVRPLYSLVSYWIDCSAVPSFINCVPQVLIDWINDELADFRIIVKDLEEDLFDGQILQKLIGTDLSRTLL